MSETGVSQQSKFTGQEIGGHVISDFVNRKHSRRQAINLQERLGAFVDVKIRNREALARSGCPVGTLCSELHKEGGTVARKSTILFVDALDWMESQFRALGKKGESRSLAIHLLAATQGVSVLAHTFHDPQLIEIEAKLLKRWIRAL